MFVQFVCVCNAARYFANSFDKPGGVDLQGVCEIVRIHKQIANVALHSDLSDHSESLR